MPDYTSEFEEKFVQTINKFIQESDKLVILGIGNENNGDDAVGLNVITLLQQAQLPPYVTLFYCERVPEHFLGKIRKVKPNKVLVIDAADMKEVPGAIAIFPEESISGGFHFSTHTLSVTMLGKFLRHSISDLEMMYIGIQPKQTIFEAPLSLECEEAAKELADFLIYSLVNKD